LKNLSDEELLTLIKKNDKLAFRILIERYEKSVAATVINMLGYSDEADDVGQEVFIRFYQNINQYQGNSSLKTYLTRIAINLSLNELKRRQLRNLRFIFWNRSTDDEDDKTMQIADPTDVESKRDAANLVQKALQKIEIKLRSVIVLRLIEGYDTRETAEILEIPQGTVLSRLSRGQEKLKTVLIELGYEK